MNQELIPDIGMTILGNGMIEISTVDDLIPSSKIARRAIVSISNPLRGKGLDFSERVRVIEEELGCILKVGGSPNKLDGGSTVVIAMTCSEETWSLICLRHGVGE